MSKKVGRPSLGITRKVSITLTEEDWKRFEEFRDDYEANNSELLREMIKTMLNAADKQKKGVI